MAPLKPLGQHPRRYTTDRTKLEIFDALTHPSSLRPRGTISFELLRDMTEHPVVTLRVSTQGGVLEWMGEPEFHERTLRIRGAHAGGLEANRVGAGNLLQLAQALMEELDVDEIVIEGADRTSGSGPGRGPARIRLRRHTRRQKR
jgi:hypothetical protein